MRKSLIECSLIYIEPVFNLPNVWRLLHRKPILNWFDEEKEENIQSVLCQGQRLLTLGFLKLSWFNGLFVTMGGRPV